MGAYIPQRGDIIWLDFNPQAGHEQAGRRPALVISHTDYNRKVGLIVCCPVTGQIKGYPFEVALPEGLKVQGAVLSDQVKSMDWSVRKAKLIDHVPDAVIKEVVAKVAAIITR